MKTIRLTIRVKTTSSKTALGIAEGAARHLLDTFNDDETLQKTIDYEVTDGPKKRVTYLTLKG